MIKAKSGNCIDCSNHTLLIAKRCSYCYWKHRNQVKSANKISIKRSQKIKPLSAKRKSENAQYLKRKCDYMLHNKYCEAKLSGCTKFATDIHHKKGRIGNLLNDENFFMAVCRSCHSWIELNPLEAKEMGFSLSRLKI